MNRYCHLAFSIIIPLTLICCGGNKTKPDPDEFSTNTATMVPDSSHVQPEARFYELEESIEDIQRQIVSHGRMVRYI